MIIEIIIRSNNYNFGSICISLLNFDCHSGSKGARIYTLNSCKQDKNQSYIVKKTIYFTTIKA